MLFKISYWDQNNAPIKYLSICDHKIYVPQTGKVDRYKFGALVKELYELEPLTYISVHQYTNSTNRIYLEIHIDGFLKYIANEIASDEKIEARDKLKTIAPPPVGLGIDRIEVSPYTYTYRIPTEAAAQRQNFSFRGIDGTTAGTQLSYAGTARTFSSGISNTAGYVNLTYNNTGNLINNDNTIRNVGRINFTPAAGAQYTIHERIAHDMDEQIINELDAVASLDDI